MITLLGRRFLMAVCAAKIKKYYGGRAEFLRRAFNIPVILNIIQINDILWFGGSELRIYYLNLANQCYIKLCICYLFLLYR